MGHLVDSVRRIDGAEFTYRPRSDLEVILLPLAGDLPGVGSEDITEPLPETRWVSFPALLSVEGRGEKSGQKWTSQRPGLPVDFALGFLHEDVGSPDLLPLILVSVATTKGEVAGPAAGLASTCDQEAGPGFAFMVDEAHRATVRLFCTQRKAENRREVGGGAGSGPGGRSTRKMSGCGCGIKEAAGRALRRCGWCRLPSDGFPGYGRGPLPYGVGLPMDGDRRRGRFLAETVSTRLPPSEPGIPGRLQRPAPGDLAMTPLSPGSSEDVVLTGACEISLERAILRYRPPLGGAPSQGAEDLGLGVVLAASPGGGGRILDLGSGEVRLFNPDGPVVLLGWVLASAVERIRLNLDQDPQAVRRMGFAMALKILNRTGFGALTRPLLLRLGFRDIVQDIDPHEGAAIRIQVPGRGVITLLLDADSAAAVVDVPWEHPSPALEEALAMAFTAGAGSWTKGEMISLSRAVDVSGRQRYRLDLPVPDSVTETRELLARVRAAAMSLVSLFEPERHGAVAERVQVFGARDSLRQVREGGGSRRFPVFPSTRLRASSSAASGTLDQGRSGDGPPAGPSRIH